MLIDLEINSEHPLCDYFDTSDICYIWLSYDQIHDMN
jgi:hypothetical protein